MALEHFVEEIQVLGRELADKLHVLLHEGNVRRVIVKDKRGRTFAELPISVAAVGAIAAPLVAVLGTISAMVAQFTIVIERADRREPSARSGETV